MTEYLGTLSDTDKKNAAQLTLKALIDRLSWKPEDSIVTAAPDEYLSVVQNQVNDSKNCADAFVTEDGTKAKPASRWITDQDILKLVNA